VANGACSPLLAANRNFGFGSSMALEQRAHGVAKGRARQSSARNRTRPGAAYILQGDALRAAWNEVSANPIPEPSTTSFKTFGVFFVASGTCAGMYASEVGRRAASILVVACRGRKFNSCMLQSPVELLWVQSINAFQQLLFRGYESTYYDVR